MGKLVGAFGEGVAAFAGPLGAPIKGLLKYHDSVELERLFAKLYEAIRQGNDLSAQVCGETLHLHDSYEEGHRQVISMLRTVARLLSQNLDAQSQKLLEKEPTPEIKSQHALQISRLFAEDTANVSNRYHFTEPDLHSELQRLVGSQSDLLSTVGLFAPFVGAWLAPEMKPVNAFHAFIVGLRGRTNREKAIIFDALFEGFPGSQVFRSFSIVYRELAANPLPEE